MQRICRICGAALPEGTPPTRVFCSERCRLRDLGAWADGSYAVPGDPAGHAADSEVWDDPASEQCRSDPVRGRSQR